MWAEAGAAWKVSSGVWALVNVVVAQAASPDNLFSWGLTLAGVTIPFGVGWAWNKSWVEAVKRQNDFLREQDRVLRDELVAERAEKLKAHDEADGLRQQLAEVQIELRNSRNERDQLAARVAHLEEVIRLRKSEQPYTGTDRRRRDRLGEDET